MHLNRLLCESFQLMGDILACYSNNSVIKIKMDEDLINVSQDECIDNVLPSEGG